MGVVGTQNNLVAPFRFDEVRTWTKEIILVRNGYSWRFFDIQKQSFIYQIFDDYKTVYNSDNETIIKVFKDGNYGLISSISGQILELKYADIENISENAIPFYRTESYDKRTNKYHISYINHVGQTVFEAIVPAKIYENADCD